MCIEELNSIPQRIEKRELSKSEALNYLILFFQNNSPLFNVSNQEEDFKSEMIIQLLSKGSKLFDSYNPALGSFFNYFYSVVRNIETTCKRKQSSYFYQEEHNYSENVLEFAEKTEKYGCSIKEPVPGKVPYSYTPVDIKAFQQACKSKKYRIKPHFEKDDDISPELKEKLKKIKPAKLHKMIITITLKSSFYLNDSIIDKISLLCNYDKNELAQKAQLLKTDLYNREKNKTKLEERRNKAYFHHMKYEKEMYRMKDNPDDFDEYKYDALEKKYSKQTKTWMDLNKKLNEGYINIRPTNKAVADVLGICERQVSYYMKCLKELGI